MTKSKKDKTLYRKLKIWQQKEPY